MKRMRVQPQKAPQKLLTDVDPDSLSHIFTFLPFQELVTNLRVASPFHAPTVTVLSKRREHRVRFKGVEFTRKSRALQKYCPALKQLFITGGVAPFPLCFEVKLTLFLHSFPNLENLHIEVPYESQTRCFGSKAVFKQISALPNLRSLSFMFPLPTECRHLDSLSSQTLKVLEFVGYRVVCFDTGEVATMLHGLPVLEVFPLPLGATFRKNGHASTFRECLQGVGCLPQIRKFHRVNGNHKGELDLALLVEKMPNVEDLEIWDPKWEFPLLSRLPKLHVLKCFDFDGRNTSYLPCGVLLPSVVELEISFDWFDDSYLKQIARAMQNLKSFKAFAYKTLSLEDVRSLSVLPLTELYFFCHTPGTYEVLSDKLLFPKLQEDCLELVREVSLV